MNEERTVDWMILVVADAILLMLATLAITIFSLWTFIDSSRQSRKRSVESSTRQAE